jgi:hypothetical protein
MNQTFTGTPFVTLVAVFVASSAAAQPQESYSVVGTVRDTAGARVERAEVVVGLHGVADPRVPGGCEDRMGRLLAVARAVTNAAGIYKAAVPIPREGEAANCVIVWAALRPGLEPWGERPIASAPWQAAPLSGPGAVIDLVLSPLPPLRTNAGRGNARFRRRPDDDWADAARERVPGFAGFILDGCNVVVYLTERGREDAATEYVRETFRDVPSGHQPCVAPRPIVFRRAAYDYAELRRWYDQVGLAMGLEGVSSGAISARANRITIGVVDSVAERRVRRAIATTEVPPGAVVVEVAFPSGGPPERAPFGPETPKLGARLAAHYNAIAPAWSADSREIVFQTLDGGPGVTDFSLRAVDVTSREVRSLASVVGIASGRQASHVTADGQVFFALSDTGFGRVRGSGTEVIYRVPPAGGEPERVVDNLARPWFAVSANGQRIAHVTRLPAAERREVLTVTELPTRRQFTVARHEPGASGILGLSPDGRYLAQTRNHFAADSAGVWIFSVDDSSSRRTVRFPPLTPVPSLMVGGLRWVGDTAQVLLIERTATRDRLALTVVDGMRGARRQIGTVPAGERLPWAAAWSPDGRRVALWVPLATGPQACSPAGDCISSRVVHFRLYLLDTRNTSVQMLAEMTSTEASRWLEFSPDGQWIGYSLHGDIRVHRF